MALSSSMEDYLEAIFEIEKTTAAVRVRDVAKRLGVTMPSVNGALKNLESLGLIRHARYEYIELTPEGSLQAARIASRHRVIQLFLREIIGVDEKTAEEEACRIEHVLSLGTTAKLTEYMEQSLKRPLPHSTHKKTVNDLTPGAHGIISEIKASDSMRQRLMDLGLIEGTRVEMIRSAPLGDPIQINVRGASLAIRRSEARTLIIEEDINACGATHHYRHGRKSEQR
ncbi:MAG: DtxR family transcriptional regulator [Candidatus Latescibacter sp.]|nr:DtxR family transcriptional regulator [Candidatus Latescibacter sp.]